MTPNLRIAFMIGVLLPLGAAPAPSQTGGTAAQPRVFKQTAPETADLKIAVMQLGQTRVQMTRKLQELTALNASMRNRIVNALKICDDPTTSNAVKIDRIRKNFGGVSKDLQNQDRLGNFEIQDLMSQYNQAEKLASDVVRKLETGLVGIQKIN